MKPITILLYEDNAGYSNSFKLLAQKKGILTESYDNVDDTLEALKENSSNYRFVVLDARAYLHEGQTAGSESEAYLYKIITEIERIAKEQNRDIPFCVNTGFSDVKLLYEEVLKCPIFEKGDEERLFKYIIDRIQNDETFLIENEYEDIFKIFDSNILSKQYKHEIIEIFREIKTDNKLEYLSTLRRMRPFIEACFKKLNEVDPYLLPSEYTKKGILNISGIIYYLAGKHRFNKEKQEKEFHADQVIPEHIESSLNFVWDITSAEAMHPSGQEITSYLVKSSLFALLEYLIWFKIFYLKNYSI